MVKWYEARREELRERSNKGFTLMEMLIVVAIIAVLIAIAIPVFTSQLESSREATDKANVRSAYATMMAEYMADPDNSHSMSVKAQQTQPGWVADSGAINQMIDGREVPYEYSAKPNGSYIITVKKDGTVEVK